MDSWCFVDLGGEGERIIIDGAIKPAREFRGRSSVRSLQSSILSK